MALRQLFSSGVFEYQMPSTSGVADGSSLTYTSAGGVQWSGDSPSTTVKIVQQFVANLSGNTTTSDPFTLVFSHDLETDLVTVALAPVATEMQPGTDYTHSVPCLNTGTAGIFQWLLTPHGTIDPNYNNILPTSSNIQFDGNTNLYNCQFTAYPPTWSYSYMPMSAVMTVGHNGTINIICKASAIQQNEFVTLTRPDAFAGSSAIIGQFYINE